ncbi:hypothetical protein Q8A67_019423 [Cirrhinus molitorella]|uniref:Uncharacterized protein n=1 Tax=Cirrhinus molitorella TaxID=172907 RepID=A0AA88PFH5_9TELE|nr:hypothetical protein Q8A67_019423 [Cirrhinus molitorella]
MERSLKTPPPLPSSGIFLIRAWTPQRLAGLQPLPDLWVAADCLTGQKNRTQDVATLFQLLLLPLLGISLLGVGGDGGPREGPKAIAMTPLPSLFPSSAPPGTIRLTASVGSFGPSAPSFSGFVLYTLSLHP